MSKRIFRWKQEWTTLVVVVLALRVLYALIGFLIVSRSGTIPLDEPVYAVMCPFLRGDSFSKLFVNPWFGWDTIFYIKIAMFGYDAQDGSIAFMPLYPLLIRLASPLLGGDFLLASLFLSTLFSAVALILMYELFAEMFNPSISWQTAILYVSFPTAFFLLAGYTESLFLVCVLAFWLCGRKKLWFWAALFSGLAAFARIQAVVLAPVLVWMMLIRLVKVPVADPAGQVRQVLSLLRDFRGQIICQSYKAAWLFPVTPILVASTYQTWLYVSGLGSISNILQVHWRIQTVMPWTGFGLFLQRLFGAHFIYMDWIDLGLLVIILVASVIALRFLDPAFSLYIWLTIGILFSRGTPPFLLASYSRYFLALFPLFVLPALSTTKYFRLSLFSLFALFQIILVGVFLWGSWVA